MTTATLSSPTAFRATVERHARTLKDITRWIRSHIARTGQQAPYANEVAKANLSSDKAKAFEQLCAIVVDAARRGPVENAAQIGEQLTAIAYAEHPDPAVELSVSEAHIAEEMAEGDAEVWETRALSDPSTTNILGYLGAAAKHSAARRLLNQAYRRELAKRERSG